MNIWSTSVFSLTTTYKVYIVSPLCCCLVVPHRQSKKNISILYLRFVPRANLTVLDPVAGVVEGGNEEGVGREGEDGGDGEG